MNLNEIKCKLADVESNINTLVSERVSLQKELRAAEDASFLDTFNEWGITLGSFMIWVDKNDGYYLVRTFQVTDIDLTRLYFRAIVGNYSNGCSEPEFSCRQEWMSFSSLNPSESVYNIYFVDKEALDNYSQILLRLELDENNIKEFESSVRNVCKKSICK